MNRILPLGCRIASCSSNTLQLVPVARMHIGRNFKIPDTFENVIWPADGARELPIVPKAPMFNPELGEAPKSTTKRLIEIRGPELVHTDFKHKQYGIVALRGGFFHIEHFEKTREKINARLQPDQFAVWRLEPPWLPRTKLPQGGRMRATKGSLHHYVTPIRAGRVMIEMGGHVSYYQAMDILNDVALHLPLMCRFYSWEQLKAERAEEERIEKGNLNPYTWDYVLRWNMQNCSQYLSWYDFAWRGKYR